jgi:hypothetical protein
VSGQVAEIDGRIGESIAVDRQSAGDQRADLATDAPHAGVHAGEDSPTVEIQRSESAARGSPRKTMSFQLSA